MSIKLSFNECQKILWQGYGAHVKSSQIKFAKIRHSSDRLENAYVEEYGMDITLSKDDFERLCFVLSEIHKRPNPYHSDTMVFNSEIERMFRRALESLDDETRLREKHPSLKKIWQKYETAKALLGNG